MFRSLHYQHRAGQKKQAILKTAERDTARLRGSNLRASKAAASAHPLYHGTGCLKVAVRLTTECYAATVKHVKAA